MTGNPEAHKVKGDPKEHGEAVKAKAAQEAKIAEKKAAQAEAKQDAKSDVPEPNLPDPNVKEETDCTPDTLMRRSINRGSSRRITRALNRFDEEFSNFIKEMDAQFFLAGNDPDANDYKIRKAEWPEIENLKKCRIGILEMVNRTMHPTVKSDG